MLLHTRKMFCFMSFANVYDWIFHWSYSIPVNTQRLFVSVSYYYCVCWQNEVTMLKNEVTQLKQLLLTHKDCPITAMQKESQGYLSEYYHAPTWPGVTLRNNGCILFVGHIHWYRYLWHFWNVWRLPLPGYRGGDNSLIFSVTEELVALVVFMIQEIEILFPSLWSTVNAFR